MGLKNLLFLLNPPKLLILQDRLMLSFGVGRGSRTKLSFIVPGLSTLKYSRHSTIVKLVSEIIKT